MKKLINKEEITTKLINVDDIGMLFYWKNRVFRAIKKESVEEVKNMFNSGLIEELTNKNIFPKSWITNYALEGYELIVEHKKIDFVTYPYEWSFSMFKEAAICILKINKIAKKYGYQTKDSHGFNIIFDATTPKFVDLGSFIKTEKNQKSWRALRGFIEHYYHILKIWSKGNSFISRKLLTSSKIKVPTHEYLNCSYSFFRLININFLKKMVDIFWKYKKINQIKEGNLKEKFPKILSKVICYAKTKNLFPFQKMNYDHWIKKINRFKENKSDTQWNKYHNNKTDRGRLKNFDRFKKIIDILKKYQEDINSIVELAGNQGKFAELVYNNTNIKKIVCTDYDYQAVDKMFLNNRTKNIPITSAVLNFVLPEKVTNTKDPQVRLKASAVIALAVTHHLILTQKLPVSYVLKILKEYTTSYIFVEFMPLGLYSSSCKTNSLPPAWYNVEWFEKEFNKHFKLLEKEKIEKNRILFVGKIS